MKIRTKIRRLFRNPKRRLFLLILIFLLAGIFLVFLALVLYFKGNRSNFINRQINDFSANHPELVLFFRKVINISDVFYLFYQFVPSSIPTYSLEIDPRDLKELNENLPPPGAKLTSEYKKEIPAEFSYKGKIYKAEVRYRGDNPNHWRFEKKSWRINFKKELFEKRKSINLILPEDRHFFVEAWVNHIAEKLNLKVPDYCFVNLKINGKLHGVYLMSEQWGEEFLEKKQVAPESNLYGENDFYEPVANLYEDIRFFKKYTSEIKGVKNEYTDLSFLLDYLHNLPDEEFYRKIDNLIDMDNFYRWQAHSTLVFSRSQRISHNLILFFNREKGRFEFIPWNVAMADEEPSYPDINYNPLMTRILKNPEFMFERNQTLWNYIKNQEALNEDLAFYDNIYKKTKGSFYKDHLKLFSNIEFDFNVAKYRRRIIKAQEEIRKLLDDCRSSVWVWLTPSFERKTKAYFEIESRGFASIELKKMKITSLNKIPSEVSLYEDINGNKKFDKEDIKIGNFRREEEEELFEYSLLPEEVFVHTDRDVQDFGKEFLLKPARKGFFVVSEDNFELKDFKFELGNAFSKEETKPTAVRLIDERKFQYLDRISLSADQFAREYPIFNKDGNSDNNFILPSGIYEVDKDLIIPGTVSLEISPGVELRFAPGVSLISYGKIKARGIEGNRIIFTAQDKKNPWGVFALVDQKASDSLFENVIFEHGSETFLNGIFFSGALAVHWADVKIRDSDFLFNSGDDGLNIKHASAEVENCLFRENKFDGLDLDFIKGKVIESRFINNGNDGVDLSGSKVLLRNNQIKFSKDKCVSVGEGARPLLVNNLVLGCQIGVAVKDSSEVELVNNTIVANKTAVALYQKKEIFEGGVAKVKNSLIWNNKKDFEIDSLSKVDVVYSNLERGYDGEGNLSQKPLFINTEEGNYYLSKRDENENLLKGGKLSFLKEVISEESLPEMVPIGIWQD